MGIKVEWAYNIKADKYTGKYGWVFRQLDTAPFYNCYVSKKTFNNIKKLLKNNYKIIKSLDTDKGEEGYVLWKK